MNIMECYLFTNELCRYSIYYCDYSVSSLVYIGTSD